MAMDAWREADMFVSQFDLPGVARDGIDPDVERNVLTVRTDHLEGLARGNQPLDRGAPRV